MSMIRRIAWIAPILAITLGTVTAGAVAADEPKAPAAKPAASPGSKGHGKMVFVLTTGLEDLQAVNMAIRQSGVAHKSGYLDDTVLLVYGRSVQAFSKDVHAKPPQVVKAIKEAKEAGVRILICRVALQHFNIPEDRLEPGVAEVVPNAIETLAELVSKGYQIIKY